MNKALISQVLFLPIFALSAVLCYALTPFAIRLSRRLNLLDIPEGRKAHSAPTPLLGGLAILIAFWSVVATSLASIPLLQSLYAKIPVLRIMIESSLSLVPMLGWIFLGSMVIFLTGLLDDVLELSPLLKFTGQAVAAAILMRAGLEINLTAVFGPWGILATFAWLLLIMNAFNFIDSIDGHCAGISLISCIVFFWLAQIMNQPVVGFFVIALAGALYGFLPYNFKPAKIFLGDNGSLFLGYILGAVTLLLNYQSAGESRVALLVPLFMFGVPIYDTVSVIVVRVLRGVPPWQGDRNHFAHRLCRLGMSDKVAVLFSYFVAFTLGLIAILSTQITTPIGIALILILFLSIIGIIAFLEYYAALRLRIVDELQKQNLRRKEDIREAEDRRF